MKATATIENSCLLVHVEAPNTLSEPVYLMNWLWDWYAMLTLADPDPVALSKRQPPPTRELAFVCLGPAGEAVLLNGEGPEPPDGILPAVPRLPDSSRVQPGETLRWTIRLRLPLREWHAYDGLRIKDAVPVTVTTIRYKLESLRESACRHHQEHANFPGIFKARGYPSDKAEVTVALPEPIVLLRRSAQFQRF